MYNYIYTYTYIYIYVYIYIYICIYVYINKYTKYTTVLQRSIPSILKISQIFSFVILHSFLSSFFFFIISFQNLKHRACNLHRRYRYRFCYGMYYIVLKMCIGGRLLQDCFYCYSQQIVYALVKKSLIVYSLTQRAPEPLIL